MPPAVRWREGSVGGRICTLQIDLLFDPFGVSWRDVREGAIAAEGEGFDGVWLYDHLAGSVHGRDRVLECWTTLTAIAATVPRIAIGPMVLNVANRDPGTLGVMAATLQEVSEGRLLLGLGAGGGRDTPYAAEQQALGRSVRGDVARRGALEQAVATLRSVWSGTVGGVRGFPRPDAPPPIIIGGFGPKVAALAGRVADGVNLPGGAGLPRLLEVTQEARATAGRDPSSFVVTVSSDLRAAALSRLETLGVQRAVVFVGAPFAERIRGLAARRS
jgi:alkanesulfonate monooxygenase SsuD/methylene tetrahydromethanopterin reductase-like flavin-dependent oxidoreductase (luciferase family)